MQAEELRLFLCMRDAKPVKQLPCFKFSIKKIQ